MIFKKKIKYLSRLKDIVISDQITHPTFNSHVLLKSKFYAKIFYLRKYTASESETYCADTVFENTVLFIGANLLD